MDRIEKQIELQEIVQAKDSINIVLCPHCSTVLSLDRDTDKINCWGCNEVFNSFDCEDLYYNGMPEADQS